MTRRTRVRHVLLHLLLHKIGATATPRYTHTGERDDEQQQQQAAAANSSSSSSTCAFPSLLRRH